MKNLSYEEKLRLAKEALESGSYDKETIEYIFPELKESEDEKIRKALLREFIHLQSKGYKFAGLEGEEIIAWLVKQGEKPQGKSALEAANEEKVDNANKIKPKFKIGDWIVWQDKCYKVNYNGCGYELVDQNGLSTSLEYRTIDENAHHWDITKDAKDGDVLTMFYESKNYIFIYSGLHEKSFKSIISVFCFLEEGTYYDETDMFHIINHGEIITPATKEQRDKLLKAMADAGWQFDFEKKELKKIEGESEDCKRQIMSEMADLIKDYIRQKPDEWSEEDERMMLSIEQVMNCASLLNIVPQKIDKVRTWLKSIKERIE